MKLISWLLLSATFGYAQDPRLFEPSENDWTSAGASTAPFVRVQMGRLQADAISLLQPAAAGQSARLVLNLFSNEEHAVVLERRYALSSDRVVAQGRIEGVEASHAVLCLTADALAGSVFVPGRGIFQIQPAGDGLHRIVEMDAARMPSCGVPRGTSSATKNFQPAAGLPLGDSSPSTNVLVDLLVVYTPLARAAAGGTNGMNAVIDAAVEEANLAYENSLVNMRLRLVHRTEVDYAETGEIEEDLEELEEDESEHAEIQLIHTLRARYSADLVCLITETTGGPLGLANLMRDVSVDFSRYAFSVVQRQYANGYQVLAHELGHNMGCQHDRAAGTGPGAFSYSYARRFTLENLAYHTVMAPQPGLPIPYFSNPEVTFRGVPTGVAEQFTNSANNAKTINQTAETIALLSTVLRTSAPPRITLVSPTNGAFFLVPAQVQFSALVTNEEAEVKEVEFYLNGKELAEFHQPPFSMVWSNATPGTYAVYAGVKDESGWETSSAMVVFSLGYPPPAFDLAGCQRGLDGRFALRALGVNGLSYVIDVSADLLNWTPFDAGVFTNNVMDFIDAGAALLPERFYRIQKGP